MSTRSSRLVFLTLTALSAGANVAEARKTDFSENQVGALFGAGTYFMMPDLVDPVPAMSRTTTTTSGTKGYLPLPLKFGFHKNTGPVSMEAYVRYVINFKGGWTATGTDVGTGTTKYTSLGAGLQAGFAFMKRSRVQMLLVGNFDYVSQQLHLDFSDQSSIDLRATSYLMGGGLQLEIWLGDLWTLALQGSYQYSPESAWNVLNTTNFMGRSHAAGALKSPAGDAIAAKFGGFMTAATLKLAFY